MSLDMVSIGKITSVDEAIRYLLKTVADERLNYYGAGWWYGRGAAALKLQGEVREKAFRAVLTGTHPTTGRALGRRHGAQRVIAFDVTFSCPKSVSLLWALGDDATKQTILRSIDGAVTETADYLQDHAAWGRRVVDPTTGAVQPVHASLVVARFLHLTARPVTDPRTGVTTIDPQLHVHMVVPTWVQRDDGSWGQLHSEPLYREAAAAGAVGQAALRDTLVRTLGVHVTVAPNACFEVDGFTAPQLREFSRRTLQIEALEEALGTASLNGHKVAVLDTRQSKAEAPVGSETFEHWRDRAVAVGLDAPAIAATMGHDAATLPDRSLDVAVEALLGPTGLTREAATFRRRDVVRAVAAHVPGGMQWRELERLVHGILADAAHVVPMLPELQAGESADVAISRLRDGAVEVRYSTPEMVVLEQRMLDLAVARSDARLAVVPAASVADALAVRPHFTKGQRALVETVCRSGAGVIAIEGAAGTGKTDALDACRELLEAHGYTVVGCALAGRAAEGLQDGSAIRSFTVRKVLDDLGERNLPPKSVLVVDEAGMIGSRTMATLVEVAARDNATLVLVGDWAQLQPIDAGAAFRALADELGAVRLTQNVRQRERWEVEALDVLRRGKAAQAARVYLEEGRIVATRTARERRIQMVRDYLTALANDADAVMLAYQRADVAKLNALARASLVAAGALSGPTLRVGGITLQAGDQLLCLRNSWREGLTNGLRGTVTSVDPEHGLLYVRTPRGRDLVIDTTYYQDIDHGHAMTVHKGQGLTASVALVMGSESAAREWAYTALSRAKAKTLYYEVDHAALRDAEGVMHWTERAPSLADRIIRAWSRTSAKDSTLDYPERYVAELARGSVEHGEMGPPTDAQLRYIAALGGGGPAQLPAEATWIHASLLIDTLRDDELGLQASRWLAEAGLADDVISRTIDVALCDLEPRAAGSRLLDGPTSPLARQTLWTAKVDDRAEAELAPTPAVAPAETPPLMAPPL